MWLQSVKNVPGSIFNQTFTNHIGEMTKHLAPTMIPLFINNLHLVLVAANALIS